MLFLSCVKDWRSSILVQIIFYWLIAIITVKKGGHIVDVRSDMFFLISAQIYILSYICILTNSIAYKTQKYNTAFTRASNNPYPELNQSKPCINIYCFNIYMYVCKCVSKCIFPVAIFSLLIKAVSALLRQKVHQAIE